MNEKELLEIEEIINTNKFWTLQSGELLNIMDNLYDEIRRLKERNAQITQNYNKRVEKYYYLQQEVRRLKDELESWQGLAHDRLKNWCMFAERSSKLEKENMVYKVALEEIANHETDVSSAPNEFEVRYLLSGSYGICRRIANKALEGDTNEN